MDHSACLRWITRPSCTCSSVSTSCLIVHFFKDAKLRQITPAQIAAYQNARSNAGRAPKTINGEVSVLRQVLNRAKLRTRRGRDDEDLHSHPPGALNQAAAALEPITTPAPPKARRAKTSGSPKRLWPWLQRAFAQKGLCHRPRRNS